MGLWLLGEGAGLGQQAQESWAQAGCGGETCREQSGGLSRGQSGLARGWSSPPPRSLTHRGPSYKVRDAAENAPPPPFLGSWPACPPATAPLPGLAAVRRGAWGLGPSPHLGPKGAGVGKPYAMPTQTTRGPLCPGVGWPWPSPFPLGRREPPASGSSIPPAPPSAHSLPPRTHLSSCLGALVEALSPPSPHGACQASCCWASPLEPGADRCSGAGPPARPQPALGESGGPAALGTFLSP